MKAVSATIRGTAVGESVGRGVAGPCASSVSTNAVVGGRTVGAREGRCAALSRTHEDVGGRLAVGDLREEDGEAVEIGLKDLIDTAGVKTTCGSALFADRVPDQDAEVVRRLKTAGAVLIGKQNMQEFAYGGTSTSSYFGPVHNPWDVDRIAGGSSGGSAAAVATGMCFGAIGTDTGGRSCRDLRGPREQAQWR